MNETPVCTSIKARVGEALSIPAEALAVYGEAGEEVTVEVLSTRQGILLRPTTLPPIEIYTDERIAEFRRDDAEVSRILREAGLSA